MAIPFSIVDCRTAPAEAGTAVAVVHLRSLESDGWMRDLAAFLATPVTVFARAAPGGHRARLFAGDVEVEYSGAGLAAAAHALWEADLIPAPRAVRLLTPLGEVDARRSGVAIELDRAGRTVFAVAACVTVARGELVWPA